jgi:hypothetical protein
MEVESHDEADHERACGAIESVFIKEEVVEDEGPDEEIVSSSNNSIDSDTVPRTIESVYIKEESIQFETDEEEEELSSVSLSSETAVSDSSVCLSGREARGSKCIKASAHPPRADNTVRVKRPRKRKVSFQQVFLHQKLYKPSCDAIYLSCLASNVDTCVVTS